MSSQKIESDNMQIQNKSNNPSQQQKEQQGQQIAEHTIATTATISKTTNEDTRRINENQKINKAILDKSTDITKFINNTSADNKYYNVAVLEQIKVFNKINQNMIDNAINNTRTIHELLTEYIEIFNKSIELGQQCYKDGIKNYFNFGKKI
jgi:hypothetical protein